MNKEYYSVYYELPDKPTTYNHLLYTTTEILSLNKGIFKLPHKILSLNKNNSPKG
jgi:hypothetical protein